ncbi:MoaD/ThiS family protein [Candidatus Woesearchaeota archaeon]|nr:MoaD/ThiS family protein [Candidatus Woesearchaeota archaeon]
MRVYIEKEEKYRNIEFKGTVKGLLKELKINKETVIVTREHELISDNDNLSNSDEIEILSVISGG